MCSVEQKRFINYEYSGECEYMRIAVITITFNDDYKVDQWASFYNDYKDSIYLHIIVDNGSSKKYVERLKELFPNSVILENQENLGLTKAYNIGIRYAFEKGDVDYIMLLANDIQISSESIKKMASFLGEGKVDSVAPIMFEKNGYIADYGCSIDKHLMLKPFMAGKSKELIQSNVNFCEALTGGCNMSTINFFQVVGLQDEALFMYSDEVDMGIRAKKCGMKMACISTSECFHMHINPENRELRLPFSSYLIARNKIYLAKKHKIKNRVIPIAFVLLKQSIKCFILGFFGRKKELRLKSKYIFAGIIHGLRNDMRQNKYTKA